MNYYTYWSILEAPSNSVKSNLIGLIIALIAGIAWLLIKKFKKNDGNKTLLLLAVGTFSILGLAMFIVFTFVYPDSSKTGTEKFLASSPVAEGIVSNFQTQYRTGAKGGETIETFSLDSIRFAYGDALLGQFNSFSKTHNGVIYNGQKLRVTYRKGSRYGDEFNSILKIEIGASAVGTGN